MNFKANPRVFPALIMVTALLFGCASLKYSKDGKLPEDVQKDYASCAAMVEQKYSKLAPDTEDPFLKLSFYFKTQADREKAEKECMTSKGYRSTQ